MDSGQAAGQHRSEPEVAGNDGGVLAARALPAIPAAHNEVVARGAGAVGDLVDADADFRPWGRTAGHETVADQLLGEVPCHRAPVHTRLAALPNPAATRHLLLSCVCQRRPYRRTG